MKDGKFGPVVYTHIHVERVKMLVAVHEDGS